MRKKIKSIPVNNMAEEFGAGIAIGRASIKDLEVFREAGQAHRDDYHLFFLQEEGTISLEIDFQKHKIESPSVLYIHPNQVHRLLGAGENVKVSFWVINNENLNPEYLKILEEITPVAALPLTREKFAIVSEALSLCMNLSDRKHEKLYHSLLRDSCNILVALIASQYLAQSKPLETLSRFEMITKAFKTILEYNFMTAKKPAEYAHTLNISTPYLNECVKNTTGYTVSHHIQQRVTLEAKRLLYHSNKSVKEIASELGYDDYPYFSRMFTKVSGMTPLTFRNKNFE